MTATTAALHRQIGSAQDLKSVVRTMKASAASAIGQYERSVAALAAYAQAVELGLGLCLRKAQPQDGQASAGGPPVVDTAVQALVFGSDQGLVGRFNEVVVEHARQHLDGLTATVQVWAVGQRVQARLQAAGLHPVGLFPVPRSVGLITQLVGQILLDPRMSAAEAPGAPGGRALLLFHNRPAGPGYEPVSHRLLPLDGRWQHDLSQRPWPAGRTSSPLPEILGTGPQALRAFVREHLFVSLFRACAESLASENASRLAAMQRADRNIDDLLADLGARFHRIRQGGIDEELFDVIAGFDALAPRWKPLR